MENISETAEDLATHAKEKIDNAKDAAQEADAQLGRWSDEVREFYKERPGLAVGIGVLAGAVAGMAIFKAFSPSESSAERKVLHAVRTGEAVWRQLREGLAQTAEGWKGIMGAFRN